MLQRSSIRVIHNLPISSIVPITNLLNKLHWLPLEYWSIYKILVLTHNAFHNNSTLYLAKCISKKVIERSYRPEVSYLLSVPYHKNKYRLRSFMCAAPTLWNKLPPTLRSTASILLFKKLLKNHLFTKAYSLTNWFVSDVTPEKYDHRYWRGNPLHYIWYYFTNKK